MARHRVQLEEPSRQVTGLVPVRFGTAERAPGRERGWGVVELVIALRWTGLTLSVIAMVSARASREEIAGAVALVLYALLRTVWPIAFEGDRHRLEAAVTFEALGCAAIAGWTGLAASPFLLSLGASLLLAGLAVGVGVALVALGAAGIAALTAWASGALHSVELSGAPQRGGLLVLICVLGAYSAHLLRPPPEDQTEELERLRGLSEVNGLLLELHSRAASLPGSISLRGVVASTVARLRDLLHPELVVLLLRDPTAEAGGRRWEVAVAEGVSIPTSLADEELPPALEEAARSLAALRRAALRTGEGLGEATTSGLYIPLWARETLVGLLAVERGAAAPAFGEDDVDIVAEVARHAGLAIDNARWFRRLRTLGAEEERGRIARELHDRVGQSLAFVALSLDRIATELDRHEGDATGGAELRTELGTLAAEVRGATADLRAKLSDLRLDPSGETGLEGAIARLLERVEQRSGIATSLEHHGGHRLAPIVEREVWWIAQEAIVNAERHSGARSIAVRFELGEGEALLEVADDGRGTAATAPLRQDAFGILGMRERADAIGASLALLSPPGQGTTVRLRLGPR